jgi:hypothetical protein
MVRGIIPAMRAAVAVILLLAATARADEVTDRMALVGERIERYNARLESHRQGWRLSGMVFVASGLFDTTLTVLGSILARGTTIGKLAEANAVIAACELGVGIPLWAMGRGAGPQRIESAPGDDLGEKLDRLAIDLDRRGHRDRVAGKIAVLVGAAALVVGAVGAILYFAGDGTDTEAIVGGVGFLAGSVSVSAGAMAWSFGRSQLDDAAALRAQAAGVPSR